MGHGFSNPPPGKEVTAVYQNTLASFTCSSCRTTLGWTSPGEAQRMGKRSRVYCDQCKEIPSDLTDRQREFVNHVAAATREGGSLPSLTEIGRRMGVSRSRVQQIRDVVQLRRPDLLSAITTPSTSAAVPRRAEHQAVELSAEPSAPSDETINPDLFDPASRGEEFV